MRCQLLAMDSNGTLFRFCPMSNWQRWTPTQQVNFDGIDHVRDYMFTHPIMALPDVVDAYIAEVDLRSMIRKTHSVHAPGGEPPTQV